jgi:hypothetical protein
VRFCALCDDESTLILICFMALHREVGLRDYLNAVLGHCNDDQCVLLSRFLHVNRHVRQLQRMDQHRTCSAVEHALSANRRQEAQEAEDCSSYTDRGRSYLTTGTLAQSLFVEIIV